MSTENECSRSACNAVVPCDVRTNEKKLTVSVSILASILKKTIITKEKKQTCAKNRFSKIQLYAILQIRLTCKFSTRNYFWFSVLILNFTFLSITKTFNNATVLNKLGITLINSEKEWKR